MSGPVDKQPAGEEDADDDDFCRAARTFTSCPAASGPRPVRVRAARTWQHAAAAASPCRPARRPTAPPAARRAACCPQGGSAASDSGGQGCHRQARGPPQAMAGGGLPGASRGSAHRVPRAAHAMAGGGRRFGGWHMARLPMWPRACWAAAAVRVLAKLACSSYLLPLRFRILFLLPSSFFLLLPSSFFFLFVSSSSSSPSPPPPHTHTPQPKAWGARRR